MRVVLHDDPETMVVRIESVLAARDPSIVDDYAWEEFELRDVKVYSPDRRRHASILSASAGKPVTVIGKLKVSREQRSLGKTAPPTSPN
ncbi:hypothetical protein KEM55_001785 [Ascosphaera atra]|nr:hypothetical protein KEM55_001785 [Ascosphaera atra]